MTDLDRVLELVVKRSRALIDARAAEIALLDGDEFVIAAVAGEGVEGLKGTRMPIDDSLAGAALQSGRLQRFDRDPAETRSPTASSAPARRIVTPMIVPQPPGRLPGRLRPPARTTGRSTRRTSGFCRRSRRARRSRSRPRRTRARRRCGAASRRPSPSARRWARELHDETLQQLAGLRVLLSGARRSGDPERIGGRGRRRDRAAHDRRSAICAR